MPYSLPAGNAAHFSTTYPEFPRAYNALFFNFRAAGYTAPAGDNVQAQFQYVPPDLVPPAGNAANFVAITGDVTFEGNGAATVEIAAAGLGYIDAPAGIGSGAGQIDIEAAGAAGHGVAGQGAAAIDPAATGTAAHGVAGSGDVGLSMSATGAGVVMRYELAGEVRLQGALVNRLVRAYRRDTGELVGEQQTVAGKFRMHAGFVSSEHYLIPIDTANNATDWAPPCANRVVSVLAQDSV